MSTPAQALSPEELIRQKLAAILAAGKILPAPTVGTGKEWGAPTSPQGPAAPTMTPVTPQGNGRSMTPASAATVEPKPYQADEDWAKMQGGLPGQPPGAPGWKSTLAHALAFGAMEFGRPGEGARAESQWAGQLENEAQQRRNFPVTIHQAREQQQREQDQQRATQLGQEKTQADIENIRSEIKNREEGAQPKQSTREQLEAQFREQTEKGDQNAANVTLDMMTRLYPKDFKDADAAEMAKIPPQVLTQSGPKPVTPVWGPPGQAPTTFKSTAEAQAAWGQKVQELQTKASNPEGKIAPEVEAQIGAQPLREHFAQGPQGDQAFAAANKVWGKAAETIKNEMAAAAGQARGAAYGRNRPVEVLDTWNGNRPIRVSAGEQEDNPGRYVNATGGTQALKGGVTLDDITGALNNVKLTSHVLDRGTVNRGVIAAVLADPNSTAATFLQSAPAAELGPDEQDYVIAVLTAREVIPGLRGILGAGSATDARVKLMLSTLPGAQTPSSDYAAKQIDSQLKTVERVRPAIPNVTPQGAGAPATKEPTKEPEKPKSGFAEWEKKQAQGQTAKP